MDTECSDCGITGDVETLDQIRNFWDRVTPGEIMPAGECPHCGALCHATQCIVCPFCGQNGHNKVGLKNHLLNGHCKIFDSTARV